eukprot:gene18391-28363_t
MTSLPAAEASMSRMADTTMAGGNEGVAVVDDGTGEDVLEKLKVLNYYQDFAVSWPNAKNHHFKPLTRAYFTVPAANLNEQYFYFASIVCWLVGLCGGKIEVPDQFDDPTVTSTNIIQALKELDMSVREIMPSKIRQGHGDCVLLTLSMLCDQALKEKGVQFLPPTYPSEKYDEDLVADDSAAAAGPEDEIADDVPMREASDDDD